MRWAFWILAIIAVASWLLVRIPGTYLDTLHSLLWTTAAATAWLIIIDEEDRDA